MHSKNHELIFFHLSFLIPHSLEHSPARAPFTFLWTQNTESDVGELVDHKHDSEDDCISTPGQERSIDKKIHRCKEVFAISKSKRLIRISKHRTH